MIKVNKIFLVKREVVATSIAQALTKRGTIYEVVESTNEPIKTKKQVGFIKKIK